ncbi:TPA: hypothetical protein ACPTVN_005375 [Klebsiella pneumoniae]|uniref:hypothetical protein n=1 Tax=Gammaproteobacteria TaxID=1236 RepID=UPI0019F2DF34|nr:hypothetical protein [Escherichia coli]MCC4710862.1 hypothetical protein [Escherichia coli]HAO8168649.1 hypothetical protein [Salmonella enterica subsp. enterica serovar Infantis]HAX4451963.1 hypothetical protein [Escherichia coli]HBX0910098.1 hypothetical protein [Klebsiella pneumoniae]
MFGQLEHEALMRLMTHATGFVPDSRRIAYWLQEWEHLDDSHAIKTRVPGLAPDHAKDVQTVAQAAKRTGAKPSTLGRLEYGYNMENIARAYPLPVMEFER